MRLQFLRIKVATAMLAALIAPTTAQAATLSLSHQKNIDIELTDFTKEISLPQFDASLGDLTGVFLELTGKVEGGMKIENTNAASATVTGDVGARIWLKNKSNNSILPVLVTLPKITKTKQLSRFDGALDFTGPSGISFENLTSEDTKSETFNSGSLTPFIGPGTLDFLLNASAESGGRGAGNLLQQFYTSAGAGVRLTYTYLKKPEPPKKKVPESQIPVSALAALGIGMVLARKLQKSSK